LVLVGGIAFRIWQTHWHREHGGDGSDDAYDSAGGGL
jgi:hypothetical protein